MSWSAGNRYFDSTVYLRRSGLIDLFGKDKDGRSAISWACSGVHYEVANYLIKYDHNGVDYEIIDGWTHLA